MGWASQELRFQREIILDKSLHVIYSIHPWSTRIFEIQANCENENQITWTCRCSSNAKKMYTNPIGLSLGLSIGYLILLTAGFNKTC